MPAAEAARGGERLVVVGAARGAADEESRAAVAPDGVLQQPRQLGVAVRHMRGPGKRYGGGGHRGKGQPPVHTACPSVH